MEETQWDKIQTLFEEAREVPPGERAAFLNERCEEKTVRKEVLSLLEAEEEAGGFFDGLASALPSVLGEEEHEGPDVSDPLGLEGEAVGRYRIEEHLGSGGMGVVYKARDPDLSRRVALKFLPPHLSAHPEAEERFVREARSAAALEHANIATIHEIGATEDGRRFIAMTYYEGETLKEKLDREGPLPIEEAIGYAEQIAEALSRAHEAGIIHRDVKPANVMVTEAGEVKLLDFGLAKAAAETRLTDPGQQMGTAAYMSPEQAEGKEVDGRTDLWALGALLYEMLAGTRPFQGDRRTAIIHSILNEEPAPLGDLRDEVSSGPEQVVHRCLQKNPEERYASADRLLGDLDVHQSGTDTVPSGGLSSHKIGSDLWGRRGLVGAAVALILAVGVAAGWIFWPEGGAPEEPDRSIAVLPFANLSGSEKARPLVRGLHDDLLTRLSNVSDLNVISRTSVEKYRGTDLSLPAIADSLGAKWIVEGGVQQSGGQIQVNAQLIDSESDVHRWSDSYQRALTTGNLFAIQGEITSEIAGALQAELTSGEQRQVRRRLTDDLKAYRLYTEGRGFLKQRTDSTLKRSADLFRQAIERDSTFATAWAGLADARMFLGTYADTAPDSMLPAATDAARRALELDPALAEAHVSLSRMHFYRGRLPAALREAERAIELRPSYAVAHNLRSVLKLTQGRLDEALKGARRAVDLDPLAPEHRRNLSGVHRYRGEIEQALEQARREKGIEPKYGGGRVRLTLAHVGRTEEAISMLEAGPDSSLLADYYRTLAGDTSGARRLLPEVEGGASAWPEGLAQAVLGRHQTAIETFRQDFQRREIWTGEITWRCRYPYPPGLEPLRETSAFQAFLQEVNQAWGLNPDGTLPEETSQAP